MIDAELNGVPVSALIDFGAQGCFISYEAVARLHPSGRKKREAPVRIRCATGTIKDCFESFPEALLTLDGHPTILEAIFAPISHHLILGQKWLHDTNSLIEWKKRTLTFERGQRPFATSSEAPKPTRCELLIAKLFRRMLRKEKVHCCALFLDGTPAQSYSEESLECLKLEIIADLTEVSSGKFPKALPSERIVDHRIDLLPRTKPFSRAPTDSPRLRPMRLRKLCTNFSSKFTFARVRLHQGRS
jgi:hypothetical protein